VIDLAYCKASRRAVQQNKGSNGFLTIATRFVLPLRARVWHLRARFFHYVLYRATLLTLLKPYKAEKFA
jgi:hypothetical protein